MKISSLLYTTRRALILKVVIYEKKDLNFKILVFKTRK